MRALTCEAAETALLERHPDPDGSIAAHVGGCGACADLAAALHELEPLVLAPQPAPPHALVARTLTAASEECRALARARRRAIAIAGVKAAAVFLFSLPFLVGFHAGVVHWGGELVGEFLPSGAVLYVQVVLALFALGAISALAFTLTLVVGAAGKPPRREMLLEVPNG